MTDAELLALHHELEHELFRLRLRVSDHFRREGRISRCEICESGYRVFAHHEDYFEPLDVIWLCWTHHVARHKRLRDTGRDPRMAYLSARAGGRPAHPMAGRSRESTLRERRETAAGCIELHRGLGQRVRLPAYLEPLRRASA